MEWVTTYLGLGSNQGRRLDNLSDALALLSQSDDLRVLQCSSVYETAPWGYLDQPQFLNCVVAAETWLKPVPLLQLAQQVEKTVGRQPGFRWGPRAIDVDILLYGDRVVLETEPDLRIPHIRMAERAFVLVPLAEIAGTVRHPTLDVTIQQLNAVVEGKEGVNSWCPPLAVPSPLMGEG